MSPPGDEPPSDGTGDAETGQHAGDDEMPSDPVAWLRWVRRTDNGAVVFVREMVSSAAIVALVGLLLFAISGVWPPMVAVESGSMQPQMERGDLVFIMDENRLVPDAARDGTGVVTYRTGEEAGYETFGSYGDVIVYQPDGRQTTPIIHRARFWVNDSENWYDKANEEFITADDCDELLYCPAPHAGFITKGDANDAYDQDARMRISEPVKPNWIRGTAELKIPWLGWVRLKFTEIRASAAPTVVGQTTVGPTVEADFRSGSRLTG